MTTPKTLADMTPEERADAVGMWCTTGTKKHPAILIHYNQRSAYFINPGSREQYTEAFKRTCPRYDLPRAWNPDGTPP